MESPRKFNDCYFYYYSTCTKGENCVFRHEPTALGCETMCPLWQQGKCLDKRCKLRHMELRKNRKQIPCYWENQPGGCRKKHCPFQHKNPESRSDGIAPIQPGPVANNATLIVSEVEQPQQLPAAPVPAPPQGMMMPHELLWQQQQRQVVLDSAILGVLPSAELIGRRLPATHDPAQPSPYASIPVDPLVVNFEEESDNESAPSTTPTKMISPEETHKTVPWKTQELLLLEQIQAEAAAFYSYDTTETLSGPILEDVIAEKRIVKTNLSSKYDRLSLDEISGRPHIRDIKRTSLDFKILSLDEIRARKKFNMTPANFDRAQSDDNIAGRKRKLSTFDTLIVPNKVIKVVSNSAVVYKTLDDSKTPTEKVPEKESSRKRTLSLESDVLEINDEDLNNCLKNMTKHLSTNKIRKVVNEKPKHGKLKLNRSNPKDSSHGKSFTEHLNILRDDAECSDNVKVVSNALISTDESESHEELSSHTHIETIVNEVKTNEVIDISAKSKIATTEMKEHFEVDEEVSNDSITPEIENSLSSKSVPDVVASCHNDKLTVAQSGCDESKQILKEIDSFLNDETL